MAQVMLGDTLARRGIDASVRSAGLLDDGRPASTHSATLMTDRGLDLSGHTSRRMTAALLDRSDLIIGMERRHVREAAVLSRDAWTRAFTLPELARRASAAGPRPATAPLADWLVALVADRTTADHLGDEPADEVADPYGGSRRAYRRCADELEALIGVVADHLFPVVGNPTGSNQDAAVRSATP